ncbi:AAA family ATPase [Planctomycetes bacterium K23_9]|uniref:Uncharacterized protein n=1 Tax=Stieleria marina TaxID=1930275 RepID=A0A517NXN8_9BACT|nr:hypothetical protein K239x_38950 [Planctomycetes bacterium K23_9]
MASQVPDSVNINGLIDALQKVDAYPDKIETEIEVRETHISVVFLAGEFAYKVKKPIKTEFLDYSTLELRKQHCEEELRLDRRYAADMYVGVVPIVLADNRLRIGSEADRDGNAQTVDYAVKMRRFPQDCLLSERVQAGHLTTDEVHELATTIATFHQNAARCQPSLALQWPEYLVSNLGQIISGLRHKVDLETAATLRALQTWADEFFRDHLHVLVDRVDQGFVRECHGDLHLQNVVLWDGRLVPFDGIEFNERLRWIDVLCDAAFLQMDLASQGHLDLSRSYINAYLEQTGDYESIPVLRCFLIYRSLVRALVSTIRSAQSQLSSSQSDAAVLDARQHISLAFQYTQSSAPQLWITHGVSGSGKSYFSERVVQQHQAFRIRSDIERKRLFGLSPTERPSEASQAQLYSDDSNQKTYARLKVLAGGILRSGYSVIVDATFLMHRDRESFRELAIQEGVSFAILHCHSDDQTLRQRVADRMAHNDDASDAGLEVLEHQLATHQPLTDAERRFVVDVPDLVHVAQEL